MDRSKVKQKKKRRKLVHIWLQLYWTIKLRLFHFSFFSSIVFYFELSCWIKCLVSYSGYPYILWLVYVLIISYHNNGNRQRIAIGQAYKCLEPEQSKPIHFLFCSISHAHNTTYARKSDTYSRFAFFPYSNFSFMNILISKIYFIRFLNIINSKIYAATSYIKIHFDPEFLFFFSWKNVKVFSMNASYEWICF